MNILDYFDDTTDELDENDLKLLDQVEESECKRRRKC